MTWPTCPDQTPSIWRRPMTLIFLALLASGCSIQKRTVLPGFHMERMHKLSQDAEWNSPSPRNLERMTPLGCALTPPTSPQRWIRVGTRLDVQLSQDMASMQKVLPQRVDVNLGERDLQEPQPWEKEAKTQSLFGLVSLLSFCLGAILLATGTPHPFPFLLAMVALLMKKIQANKVLDIMETHGVDVGKTRLENRRESKMAWRSSLTDNEDKTQNVLGFATVMLIGLGALLGSMGTPHPLPFLLAAVAFIMKKVKANKPLFVKEAHGEDDKTRREHRQEQRRESKSSWRAVFKTALLAISGVALILAVAEYLSGSWW